MVNVHIHQFQPGGAVVDTAALAQFQEQWATYRKLVESDCLSHREVGSIQLEMARRGQELRKLREQISELESELGLSDKATKESTK